MRETFKSTVFIRYFVSYMAAVSLIITLACSALFTSAMEHYQAEKERSAAFQLRQAADAFSAVMEECLNITYQIAFNNELSQSRLENHPVHVIEGRDRLSEHLQGNAFVENILLCFPGSEIVYTNTGTMDAAVAIGHGRLDLSAAEHIFNGEEKTLLLYHPQQRKLFFYTYFYSYKNQSRGVVVYTLNNDRVQKLLHSYLGSLDAYALYSGENLLHAYAWDTAYDVLRQPASQEETVHFTKGSRTVIATNDPERSLTCLGVYTTGTPLGINSSMSLYLLLMLLLGVLLSYAFARRHYKPINQLMQLSADGAKNPAEADACRNELEYIRTAMLTSRKQNDSLLLNLQTQQQRLREEMLSRLMGGFQGKEALETVKAHVDFDIDRTPYRVLALFVVTDEGCLWQRELMNSLTERLRSMAAMTHYNDCVVLVTADELHRQVIQTVKDTVTALYGEDTVALSICTSLSHLSAKALPEAVLEALMALSRIMDSGPQPSEAVKYAAPAEQEGTLHCYLEKEFAFSISQGNEAGAMACLDEMQNQSIADGQYQYNSYRLLSVLWQSILDMPTACDEERLRWSSQMDALKEMARKMNPVPFRSQAAALLAEVCDLYRISQAQQAQRQARDVRCFIEENFCDHNLSLNTLADEFGHSSYYWSRYIKETFGVNFVVLLRRLRMDKARQLLASTKMPLSDIVSAIGYVDATSFIRRFKEEEGVTPTQWRAGRGNPSEKTDVGH